jgi:hypothetical protein
MAGPIVLSFLRDTATQRKGPYACVRLEGEIIRAEVGGPVIARHEGHEWQVEGEKCGRMTIDCRVVVHFERIDGTQSEKYGPYESVSFIDGVAYVDHQIFAFVDRSIIDWYCHEDERHWPLMIISPAQ